MTIQSILLPVFVQVLLVFTLLGLTAKSRMDAFKTGLRAKDIALSTDAYPTKSRQLSNCYSNQFEMPVLFCGAVIIGLIVHLTGTVFVVLEWLFVAARLGHAFVHTTSNTVALRGKLFLLSAVATGLLWLDLAFGVLFGVR